MFSTDLDYQNKYKHWQFNVTYFSLFLWCQFPFLKITADLI